VPATPRGRAAAAAPTRAAAEYVDDTFSTLWRLSRDARRRDDTPDGAAAPPLLDAAFLVSASKRTRFKAAVRKLAAGAARTGIDMTVTGPWPAYNFVQERAES
jgi:hypothetical protein